MVLNANRAAHVIMTHMKTERCRKKAEDRGKSEEGSRITIVCSLAEIYRDSGGRQFSSGSYLVCSGFVVQQLLQIEVGERRADAADPLQNDGRLVFAGL